MRIQDGVHPITAGTEQTVIRKNEELSARLIYYIIVTTLVIFIIPRYI